MAVYRCPVCFGKGIVVKGFYDKPGLTYYSSEDDKPTGTEQCKSCSGKGIVIT